jgi:hypothetical protein
VDFVWASPPCTYYSTARTTGPPADLDAADRLVQKCLDLAAELGAPFIMENPWTGKLKSRAVVAGIPMRVVDYCMYGAPYRKRTALWTNTEFEPARPLCNYTCGSSVGRRHLEHAQRTSQGTAGTVNHGLRTLYALPPALCDEIAAFASERVANP